MGNDVSTPYRINFEVINDKTRANGLLANAEKKDMYVEECFDDKANALARKSMTYTPNMVSLRDLNYANAYLESTIHNLPQRLMIDLDKVYIIQLMPTADGGMPHTRPDSIICLPDISQLFSKSTLIHELWHIHQRKHQDLWYKVFKRLGWTLWDGKLPEKLENNRRYNPDTIDSPFWVYNDTWLPIPIFRDITQPKINDVEIWFYNVDKNYHTQKVPSELESYFSNLPPAAYEHPREITAYMLSEPEKYKNKAMNDLLEAIGQTSLPKNTF